MSEATVRSLRLDDMDRVASLVGRLTGRPRQGFLERRFAAADADPGACLACGVEGPEGLVGYASVRVQRGEFAAREAVAVLDLIGVAPEARGRGLGKALVDHLEHQLRAKGISLLKTQVNWSDTSLVQFFAGQGFQLSSILVLERDAAPLDPGLEASGPGRRERLDDSGELARDRVLVRSLRQGDLAEVVRIDQKLTGRKRADYFAAKVREMLTEVGVRVSLVAEEDGALTGYLMARVDFGEFGKVEPVAVLDTLGVHPDFEGSGIGHALLSQLLLNLSRLQIEAVQTQIGPEDAALSRFLRACGFQQSQRLLLAKVLPQP